MIQESQEILLSLQCCLVIDYGSVKAPVLQDLLEGFVFDERLSELLRRSILLLYELTPELQVNRTVQVFPYCLGWCGIREDFCRVVIAI